MELFSPFDPTRAGELLVVKDGWLNPVFTLTDGINIYGRLSYSGSWRRTGDIETAKQNWTVTPQNLFKRELLVRHTLSAETIAIVKTSLWRGRITLELTNGQVLQLKRDGIFSKTQRWINEQSGNVLGIESRLSSYKQPFKIIPELNTAKNDVDLVLLAFLGVYLIVLRRAQAAAH